jgi:hypothetical protein
MEVWIIEHEAGLERGGLPVVVACQGIEEKD